MEFQKRTTTTCIALTNKQNKTLYNNTKHQYNKQNTYTVNNTNTVNKLQGQAILLLKNLKGKEYYPR